jgi:peptidoglycan hydrolase-like protein with peptidoglycan-binding domain
MPACSFNEPVLKKGDTGNAVRLLQTCLQQYHVDTASFILSPGPIDGNFGPLTDASLRDFQTKLGGGNVDGVAGAITWSQLDAFDSTFPGPPDLVQGATGNAVRHLQRLLFAAGSDPGSVDGIYGPNTAAAVRDFQSKEGLPQNGNASGQTRTLLGLVFG